MNINEYIPSNGVEVLFRLVTNIIETVNVDLGMLLKHLINQKYQVLESDDGKQNSGLIFIGKRSTVSFSGANLCLGLGGG